MPCFKWCVVAGYSASFTALGGRETKCLCSAVLRPGPASSDWDLAVQEVKSNFRYIRRRERKRGRLNHDLNCSRDQTTSNLHPAIPCPRRHFIHLDPRPARPGPARRAYNSSKVRQPFSSSSPFKREEKTDWCKMLPTLLPFSLPAPVLSSIRTCIHFFFFRFFKWGKVENRRRKTQENDEQ